MDPQPIRLVIFDCDGVVVDSEQTYNNMNQAMSALNSKLSLKSHLSYYTEKDLEILEINHKNKLYGWANKNGKALEFETLDEKIET